MFSDITADPARGVAIARDYESAPEYDRHAEAAFTAFRNETVRQWEELSRKVKLSTSIDDPYDSYTEMVEAVEGGSLAVLSAATTGGHPFLTVVELEMFRAVHDYHGHYMTGRDFSRHGEEAAWFRHSRMYSSLAREAMTSETRGQNSVFIWLNNGETFPVQKIITMREWS